MYLTLKIRSTRCYCHKTFQKYPGQMRISLEKFVYLTVIQNNHRVHFVPWCDIFSTWKDYTTNKQKLIKRKDYNIILSFFKTVYFIFERVATSCPRKEGSVGKI